MWSSLPPLHTYTKEMKTYIHKTNKKKNKQVTEYYSSKIHSSPKWNNLILHQYISGWIKCIVYFNEVLLSHKQKPKITDEHNPISKSCSMKDTRYKIVQIKCKSICRDKKHAIADSRGGGRTILPKHLRNCVFQRLG